MRHNTKSNTWLLLASLWVAALSLTAPIASFAQENTAPAAVDPARLAAAKELLEVTGSSKQFDVIMPMISRQLESAFIKLKPGQEAVIKEVFRIFPKKFSQRKQEAFDQVAVLYAQRFTTDELNEVSKFYRSPVGAKFVQAQPELFPQIMAIGQAWGRKIGQEIDEEARKELKQRGVPI